jgi:hypothetical protein
MKYLASPYNKMKKWKHKSVSHRVKGNDQGSGASQKGKKQQSLNIKLNWAGFCPSTPGKMHIYTQNSSASIQVKSSPSMTFQQVVEPNYFSSPDILMKCSFHSPGDI